MSLRQRLVCPLGLSLPGCKIMYMKAAWVDASSSKSWIGLDNYRKARLKGLVTALYGSKREILWEWQGHGLVC